MLSSTPFFCGPATVQETAALLMADFESFYLSKLVGAKTQTH